MGEFLILLEHLHELYERAPAAVQPVALFSLALGAFGLALAWIRSVFLRVANRRVRAALDRTQTAGTNPEETEVDGDPDRRWGEMLGLRVPRAFHDALYRLDRARGRPAGLPEEAWRGASELILADEARWETLVRGIASSTVLIGLFGAVLGFADISGDLVRVAHQSSLLKASAATQALESASAPQEKQIAPTDGEREYLWTSVQSKLGGIFISTLCGIFAALMILLVGAPFLRAAADRWLNAVEDVGRLVIIPVLPRPPTRIQDILLEELQRRLMTIAEAWENTLRGPAASIAEAADNSRRSAEAANQAFEGLRVSVEDLKELGKSATRIRTAAQSIEETAKAYVDASIRLGMAVDSLKATLPTLSEDLRSLENRFAGLEGALTTGARFVSEAGDTLRRAVADMSADFHRLESTVTARHEHESAFLKNTELIMQVIKDHLDRLVSIEQKIAYQSDQTILAFGRVGDKLEEVLIPLRDNLVQAIHDTFGKHLMDHVNALTEVRDQIRQESSATRQLLEEIHLSQHRLVAASQDLEGRAGTLADRGEELGRIADRASSLVTALDRLSEEIHSGQHKLVAAGQGLGAVLEQFSQAVTQSGRSVITVRPEPRLSTPPPKEPQKESQALTPPKENGGISPIPLMGSNSPELEGQRPKVTDHTVPPAILLPPRDPMVSDKRPEHLEQKQKGKLRKILGRLWKRGTPA